ncbi:hypothetical protein [Streptomyces sp. NPDC059788]|uniref:hypothetical protein n=1 Tax=Streptomyces sp. NPDC059788 TaxID=3346948 RepID=UPI00366235FC
MISIPLALLAGGGLYAAWRMDSRALVLVCALLLGYALAASPLHVAIDRVGAGIGAGIQGAGNGG